MHISKLIAALLTYSIGVLPGLLLNIPTKINPLTPEKEHAIFITNENPTLGTAKTDITSGHSSDKVTLTLTSKNPMLYSVKYLTINNKQICINHHNVYCFAIGESDIDIKVAFMSKVSSSPITSLALTPANQLEGNYTLAIEGTSYIEKSINYNIGDEGIITPTPLDGYGVDSVSNSGYQILKDNEDHYSFLLQSDNTLEVTFKETQDTYFTSFKKQYPNSFSTYDFKDEVTNNKVSLGTLYNALINNTSVQKNVLQQSLNLATSQAYFVTNYQSTRTTWLRSNNKIVKENITYSSNVKMAERIYYEDKTVDYYRVKNNAISSDKDASYSTASKEEMSFEYYFKNYQANLNYPTPYSLDPSVVLASSTLEKTDYGYTAILDLDPSCMDSFRNYMITTTSDADFSLARQSKAPDFISVKLTLSFNSSLLLLNTSDIEVYNVNSFAGAVKTNATSSSTYSYTDTDLEIPDINTAISYQ